MEPTTHTSKTNDKPTSTAYIPYTHTTYEYSRLSRMLAKHNIGSVVLPPRKIFIYLPPVKDALGFRHRGYTASHVNAAGFVLDTAVDPSNSETKSTIDI
jgi:hypothetical protein